jgi:hypothetical protein
LTNIYQEALKKYSPVIKNISLLFASKFNNNYTLLYKNVVGYQQLDAIIDNNGIITIGKLVLTNYNDNCFSNCKLFGYDGKCLSCDLDK